MYHGQTADENLNPCFKTAFFFHSVLLEGGVAHSDKIRL
jgi:hypothetical protein